MMKISDAKEFGDAIRKRRKELGKSIYLANMLGLDLTIKARG